MSEKITIRRERAGMYCELCAIGDLPVLKSGTDRWVHKRDGIEESCVASPLWTDWVLGLEEEDGGDGD